MKVIAASLLFATILASQAQAVNVADLRAEQLVTAAGLVKESLALTPNQQTLWKQVAAKSDTLLRARHRRRDTMQADLLASLGRDTPELRDLARVLADDAQLASAEEAELRELWLSMNDALDDRQRAVAATFLRSQLERVEPAERPARGEREQGPREERGGKRPGGGGPPRQ